MAYVQFSDGSQSKVIAWFASPQNPGDYPNYAELEDTDPRYLAFINPPRLAAIAAINAGLTIMSTASPALNGTYACDQVSQSDIMAIETSLNAGRGFPPGGAPTLNYPDIRGVMHSFNESNFTNFAAAVRDFVYGCKSVMAGASATLPSSTATIA